MRLDVLSGATARCLVQHASLALHVAGCGQAMCAAAGGGGEKSRIIDKTEEGEEEEEDGLRRTLNAQGDSSGYP